MRGSSGNVLILFVSFCLKKMSVDSWEEQSYIEVLRGRILKAISVAGEGSKSVVSLILFPHHT